MLTATFGDGDVQADIQALQHYPQFDFTAYGSPANDSDNLTLDAFKVLAKNGVPLEHSPIHLNTVDVSEHSTVDIGFVADNPGLWMLHCHNLDHAMSGMDMMLNYEGITTPFTVGNKSGNHSD